MLRIEEVRNVEEFDRIRGEWGELHALSRAPSVLLSHAWFAVCAGALSADQELLILLVREGERLVGAAPLVRQRSHVRRMPIRQIRFLEHPLTPFVDFLLIDAPAALSAILSYFRTTRTDWDVISLHKLREDSNHLGLLRGLLEKEKWMLRESVVSRTPYLPIGQSWEDFYKSKPHGFRKSRRGITNRLEALGPITIEQITKPEDAKRGLEQMLKVSEKSWTRRQGADLLSAEFERDLLTRLTKVASHAGWLRLWLLKKGDEVLASEYHIEDHQVVYGLRAHYDADYSSKSPGTYLDARIVQRLFQNGYAVYDMGPGMVKYKMAWTEAFYACKGMDIYNSSLYGQFLANLEMRWIPAAKKNAIWRWLQKPSEHHENTENTDTKQDTGSA